MNTSRGLVLAAVGLALAWAGPGRADTYELSDQTFKQVESWPPGTPEHGLEQIRRAIAERRYGRAIDLADQWIEDHPYHPRIAEAYLLRGDAKAQRHDLFKSLYDYEMVLQAYPDSQAFFPALERELQIAQTFGSGVKRKFWGMRIIPADSEAEELLIRIQERAPGSRLAEQAGKVLGDFYYNRREMVLAAEAFDIFLENYPRSQWRAEALKKLIDANLATFKGPRFDATGLIEARQRLGTFKQTFPANAEKQGADALLARIDEALAQKALVTAQWYDRKGKTVSAVFMYKRVLQDYPGSTAARQAEQRLAELGQPVTRQPTGPSPGPAPEPPAGTPATAAPGGDAPSSGPANGPPARSPDPSAERPS